MGLQSKSILFLSIFLLPFSTGCDTSVDNSPLPPEQPNYDTNINHYLDQGWSLSSMKLGGPYIGVEENNLGCTMTGDFLNLFVDNIETGRPVIPIRDPDMPCDTLEETEDSWILHCNQKVVSPYIVWWDRFEIVLDKNNWGENEYIGEFFWFIDGDEDHWCIHTFKITQADINFVNY